MVDVVLIIVTTGAMSLGCVYSWRYLARVHEASHDDRATREWVQECCRHERAAHGEPSTPADPGMSESQRPEQ